MLSNGHGKLSARLLDLLVKAKKDKVDLIVAVGSLDLPEEAISVFSLGKRAMYKRGFLDDVEFRNLIKNTSSILDNSLWGVDFMFADRP